MASHPCAPSAVLGGCGLNEQASDGATPEP